MDAGHAQRSTPFVVHLIAGDQTLEMVGLLSFHSSAPHLVTLLLGAPGDHSKAWHIPRESISLGLLSPQRSPVTSDDVRSWTDDERGELYLELTGIEGSATIRAGVLPFVRFLATTAEHLPARSSRRLTDAFFTARAHFTTWP